VEERTSAGFLEAIRGSGRVQVLVWDKRMGTNEWRGTRKDERSSLSVYSLVVHSFVVSAAISLSEGVDLDRSF